MNKKMITLYKQSSNFLTEARAKQATKATKNFMMNQSESRGPSGTLLVSQYFFYTERVIRDKVVVVFLTSH